MNILPAIDLRNGNCVRLFQGDYSMETVYETDPVSVAMEWKKQGATVLHIVDLDGAKEGKPVNISSVKQIIQTTGLPVELGGGIRNLQTAKELIQLGVDKIIIGTSALTGGDFVQSLVRLYGDKMIVSLDAKNGVLMTKGWLESSNHDFFETVKKLEAIGVSTIIYTDTVRDGTLSEPNFAMIEKLQNMTKMNLIIAGGIGKAEDVKKLAQMKVHGVIIGKALYEGTIKLPEVLAYAG